MDATLFNNNSTDSSDTSGEHGMDCTKIEKLLDDLSSSDEELSDLSKHASELVTQRASCPAPNFDLNRPLSADRYSPGPPSQHEFEFSNLDTYVYPVDMQVRDYQRNIIKKALVKNIICALPTGLGKTFIATVVMLNWFRWTKRAKIVFIAPTRPLVAQQVESFLQISGISIYETTALLSSIVNKTEREHEWQTKRVFFATAQTIENDLRNKSLDAKDIVLLVLDEAHRSRGNHSYVNVVNMLKRENQSFRILALTATPSGDFDGVQQVISNLDIAATEIRSEESLDIRKYVHARPETRVRVDLSPEIKEVLKLLASCTENQFRILKQAKITTADDVTTSHSFALRSETNRYMQSDAAQVNTGRKFQIRAISALMQSLSYSVQLLKTHGFMPFYIKLHQMELECLGSNGKNAKDLVNAPEFKRATRRCRELIYGEDRGPTGKYDSMDRRTGFMGHPKLEELAKRVYRFLESQGADSRIIVFAEFRDSAAEIVWVLGNYNSEEKQVRSSVFVGQATVGKTGVKGMNQKEQQSVLTKFKNGDFNVLVATSIGEEGLDIGQVDMIICYDQSKSPIRSIQRRGRTGRKRDGEVVLLLTAQEEAKLSHAYGGNKYVRTVIQDNAGAKANKDLVLKYASPNRLIPEGYEPTYTEVNIILPPENEAALASGDIITTMRKMKTKSKRPISKKQKIAQHDGLIDFPGFRPASELFEDDRDSS